MSERFFPVAAHTLAEAGVDASRVEGLLLRALYVLNGATSSKLAMRLCLPSTPLREVLSDLKQRNLVVHRSAAMMTGDFQYDLSEAGRQRAETLMRRSAWSAAAPVQLGSWLESIEAQSVRDEVVGLTRLEIALEGIALPSHIVHRLGMALATGKALFLHGAAGNGKTSVAERLTAAYDHVIFVPRIVEVEGHLIRVFDPMVHRPTPDAEVPTGSGRLDPRWVCCARPTVLAGGELRMEMLELSYNEDLGVCEAPLQVKASGGTLVIDDFGRQQISPRDLLNRWIVPLERRVDYLSLPDGTKLEMPFDPFVVFSTNLDPSSLVDEAFLRRIPYKIKLPDPDPHTFLALMRAQANTLGLAVTDNVLVDFLNRHYADRPMRACHPRDLLRQVRDRQRFLGQPLTCSTEALDEAASIYFVDLP